MRAACAFLLLSIQGCAALSRTKEPEHALPGVKIFFVNADSQVARKECISKQLTSQNLKHERFPAITEDNPFALRANNNYKSCFTGGIDHSKILSHGSAADLKFWQRSSRILANWCSHMRLLERAQQDNEADKAYDYVLMLEDDVLLDREKFVPELRNFIEKYEMPSSGAAPRQWDLVQLDAFGPDGKLERKDEEDRGYVKEARLADFDNKQVYMPEKGDGFWGFQAVLVRTSSIPKLLEKMSKMPAVPIDWLHKKINEDHYKGLNALTYQAGITANPEAVSMKDAGKNHNLIQKPDYCSNDILKSTIA